MSVAPLAIFISLTTSTFTTFFVCDKLGIHVAAAPGLGASHQQLGKANNEEPLLWLLSGASLKKRNKLPMVFSVVSFSESIILVGKLWGNIVWGPTCYCHMFLKSYPPFLPQVNRPAHRKKLKKLSQNSMASKILATTIPPKPSKVIKASKIIQKSSKTPKYSWKPSLTMRPNY